MKGSKRGHKFTSKLERIAEGMEYYAVSVPAKTTQALGTHGPVPVSAQINGSESFIASLYPIGGGRHYLRIRNKICKSVNIKEGDPVEIRFTVRDRSAEVSIPKDLKKALREEKMLKYFEALPIGQRSYLLRLIDETVKPQTRDKRIQDAVKAAHEKEKVLDIPASFFISSALRKKNGVHFQNARQARTLSLFLFNARTK